MVSCKITSHYVTIAYCTQTRWDKEAIQMSRGMRIAVIVLSSLLGLWFLLAGAQKFLAREVFVEMFAGLGLPASIVPVIGVLEVVAALLVLVPRTSLYGAALIVAIMVGALFSHLTSGVGSPVAAILALVLASTVAAARIYQRRDAQA